MLWALLSFASAFFDSLGHFFTKKSLNKVDQFMLLWFLFFFGAVVIFPYALFLGFPQVTLKFCLVLLGSGILNAFGWTFFFKAIKSSEISLSIPFITFIPVFLLVTSPIMLGEIPSLFGIFGIFIIVIGAYLINIDIKKGFFEPFKAIIRKGGPRYMLFTALIWSICANLDKMGIQLTTPVFWVLSINSVLALIFFIILIFKKKNLFLQLPNNWKLILPIGFVNVFSQIAQMTAFSLAHVAYVIAIKDVSPLLTVTLGAVFLKEKNFSKRIFGALVMFAGVLFILLT